MATEERTTDPRRDWTALPDLALAAIATTLRSLTDFQAFREVCRSWRLTAKAARSDFFASLPPLVLCNFEKRGFLCHTDGRFYTTRELARRRVTDGRRLIGFSHGYLILLSWKRPWLLDPFTGAEVWDFPCSPPNVSHAILSSPPTSPECALLLFDRSTVRYCRLRDSAWTFLHERIRSRTLDCVEYVEDIAFAGGRGYLLCESGKLATFDLAAGPELTVLERAATPAEDWNELAAKRKSLVEFKGELFVFTWDLQSGQPPWFLIFQFDADKCQWRRLEKLGDRALFVNKERGGTFVDNHARWGGRGDAVYFLQQFCHTWSVGTFHPDTRGGRFLSIHPYSDEDKGFFYGIWVTPSSCI